MEVLVFRQDHKVVLGEPPDIAIVSGLQIYEGHMRRCGKQVGQPINEPRRHILIEQQL